MAVVVVDEFLAVFRELELEQLLEVLCVLFLELTDFSCEAVDGLDCGCL